jgi:hypothetical protein
MSLENCNARLWPWEGLFRKGHSAVYSTVRGLSSRSPFYGGNSGCYNLSERAGFEEKPVYIPQSTNLRGDSCRDVASYVELYVAGKLAGKLAGDSSGDKGG